MEELYEAPDFSETLDICGVSTGIYAYSWIKEDLWSGEVVDFDFEQKCYLNDLKEVCEQHSIDFNRVLACMENGTMVRPFEDYCEY